jgi:hypothetical protein
MEKALQRLENVTLEESRMTGAQALMAIQNVGNMVQGVTNMLLQGVGGIEQSAINGAQTVQLARPKMTLTL